MPDDRLHPVFGHQLELLQLADAPLPFCREREAPLERLELLIVSAMLTPEAPELLVLGRESFDEGLLIHARPPLRGGGTVTARCQRLLIASDPGGCQASPGQVVGRPGRHPNFRQFQASRPVTANRFATSSVTGAACHPLPRPIIP